MKNKGPLSVIEYLMLAMLPPIIIEILVLSGIQRTFWLYFSSYIVITILTLFYIKYKKSKSDHTNER